MLWPVIVTLLWFLSFGMIGWYDVHTRHRLMKRISGLKAQNESLKDQVEFLQQHPLTQASAAPSTAPSSSPSPIPSSTPPSLPSSQTSQLGHPSLNPAFRPSAPSKPPPVRTPRLNPSPLRRYDVPRGTPYLEPVANYVFGYRAWKFLATTGPRYWDVLGKTHQDIGEIKVNSLSDNLAWYPGVNVAQCTAWSARHGSDHPGVPGEGCMCGFWCLDSLEEAITRGPWPNHVVGSVVGWGKCIRHSDGWRMEKSQVVAFLDPAPSKVEARSGFTIEHLERVTAEMGQLRQYRIMLKALCERWDVFMLSQADLPGFTEATVAGMWAVNRESGPALPPPS